MMSSNDHATSYEEESETESTNNNLPSTSARTTSNHHHSRSSRASNNNNNRSTNNNNNNKKKGHRASNTTSSSKAASAVPVVANAKYSIGGSRRTSSSGRPSTATSNSSNTRGASLVSSSLQSSATATTIALFGSTSKTGRIFLRLALDAGYHVRTLMPDAATSTRGRASAANHNNDDFSSCIAMHPSLRIVNGELDDTKQVKRVLRDADFVVCMLNDDTPAAKDDDDSSYPPQYLTNFVSNTLYPLMKDTPSVRMFLFQSTSLSQDLKGKTPVLSKVLKTALSFQQHFRGGRRNLSLQDHDSVIQFIAKEHNIVNKKMGANNNNEKENTSDDHRMSSSLSSDQSSSDSKPSTSPPHFAFLITRPTILLNDGPSTKQLSASKSQPGPFPITHCELAEFSLNALLKVNNNNNYNKLHNTCPYIVP